MQIINCGFSGSNQPPDQISWQDLGLDKQWIKLAQLLSNAETARPIQRLAIESGSITENRKNLIVSAPTNGGKSLVGDLVLIQSIISGGRAVLIEPLRALAQEKFDRFKTLRKQIEKTIDRPFNVAISTGDYRLEGEQYTSAPTDTAQLVVTTPERLDAIARNLDYSPWIDSIKAVCMDEAHLIGDKRRGPVIEYLLSYLKARPAAPRLVLLSASVSHSAKAEVWLSPCDSIVVRNRFPPLAKKIVTLEEGDFPNDLLLDEIRRQACDGSSSFLIFVYKTKDASSLASRLSNELGAPEFAKAYHSKMSPSQRNQVRQSYESGATRCVVATTSLAMGVNLPATHVIVRDLLFQGEGKLSISQLLQMCGRAGRGNTPGTATLIHHAKCGWDLHELEAEFSEEPLPSLDSSYRVSNRFGSKQQEVDLGLCEVILTHLSRFSDGQSRDQIDAFFRNSLGGAAISELIAPAIRWLCDPCRSLIGTNEDGLLVATSLGMHANKSTLPLTIAAGIGQLLRDLLELDPEDGYLKSWSPLDHLILLDLLCDRTPSLRQFSEPLAEQVTGWIEAYQGEKPVLFREWIHGAKDKSKACELLGSIGIETSADDQSRKLGYGSTFRSIILFDRGRGISVSDIERRWKIENLAGVEEQWRDTMIWLLNALSRVLETRCFFYHLKEHCKADTRRIRNVEGCLRTMRRQLYGLQDHLKYCSPLGGLLRSISRTAVQRLPGIGIQTIRKLERSGVTSLADLAKLSTKDFERMNIRDSTIDKLVSYLRRRSI